MSPADRPKAAPLRPDPTAARLALGMVGAAATTAIVAAIVGNTSLAVAGAATPQPSVGDAQASVPVRHVTRVVVIPSDATPPPRKVVYATPVPAPQQQQRVVVTTTQSGQPVP